MGVRLPEKISSRNASQVKTGRKSWARSKFSGPKSANRLSCVSALSQLPKTQCNWKRNTRNRGSDGLARMRDWRSAKASANLPARMYSSACIAFRSLPDRDIRAQDFPGQLRQAPLFEVKSQFDAT